ncbi:biopolymer transporter ExbD [Chitinophaga alhagiae]|uniref:Biopolymer transporter ExbD n=1 Tax=Chitinophaga alhagiae TaxID=2203219 RepID=A0ABM6WDQ4_9BACT|nr:biopolymer transporter ExbD [Chitinophaga alhagiae]AWO02247.1 biopolymer transporter ExbD [Chitinophaga alhagiae]
MAEMNTSTENGCQRGGRRSKKLSTRVDMTPMVDLGFLLITFFMLTTVLTKPGAMPLVMPADGPPTPVGDSKALTLLIHGNNRISWYDGQGQDAQHPPVIYASNFSVHNGIGEVIRAKQQKVASATGDADQLVVMIKAAGSARYRSVVDALDEMKINRVARYAITDITPEELEMLGE